MRKYFLFIAFLLALITLSGCFTSSTSDQPAKDQTEASTESIAQSTFDSSTYNNAVAALNTEMCDLINNSDLKKQCSSTIANEKIMSEAVEKSNVELCKGITDEKYAKLCELKVKDKAAIQNKSIQKQKDMDARQAKIADIVATGDAKQCKQLEESDVAGCEYNIYTTKALNTKDDSLCEKISDQILVNKCKEGVEIAENFIPSE